MRSIEPDRLRWHPRTRPAVRNPYFAPSAVKDLFRPAVAARQRSRPHWSPTARSFPQETSSWPLPRRSPRTARPSKGTSDRAPSRRPRDEKGAPKRAPRTRSEITASARSCVATKVARLRAARHDHRLGQPGRHDDRGQRIFIVD
jgi:hypothetical protein